MIEKGRELLQTLVLSTCIPHGVWVKLGQAENDGFSREVKKVIINISYQLSSYSYHPCLPPFSPLSPPP